MAGIRITLKKLHIGESGTLTRTRKQVVEEVLEEAAAEGLRAALLLVPVDSGESKGAFRKVGKRVKVDFTISPRRTVKGKNPQTGSRKSEFEISLVGGEETQYKLKFSSTVWQLNYLAFGLQAFSTFKGVATRYIEKNLPARLKSHVLLEVASLLELAF